MNREIYTFIDCYLYMYLSVFGSARPIADSVQANIPKCYTMCRAAAAAAATAVCSIYPVFVSGRKIYQFEWNFNFNRIRNCVFRRFYIIRFNICRFFAFRSPFKGTLFALCALAEKWREWGDDGGKKWKISCMLVKIHALFATSGTCMFVHIDDTQRAEPYKSRDTPHTHIKSRETARETSISYGTNSLFVCKSILVSIVSNVMLH